jgi:hypothetical protein
VTHIVTSLLGSYYIGAYLLKARTVVPEKQPLLANGSETTFVSRHRQQENNRTPVARQQVLNNAPVGLQQWQSCGFYVKYKKLKLGGGQAYDRSSD